MNSVLAESLMTKVQGAIGSVLPDTVTSEMSRKLNQPGSANK
ncbi:hypothetical protein [Phormidesmis priestleyi]|nr:hypothetical protein [Phormidesmis priestleyi]